MNFIQKSVLLLVLSASVAAGFPARGEEQSRYPQLEDRLRSEVEFLCDSMHRGRGFGTTEKFFSTGYIISSFKHAGLQPLQGGYLHNFYSSGKPGRNVIGIRPSRYVSNGAKYILVASYSDGLGCLQGRIYPGADSNASGVAAVLALADSLKAGVKGIIFAVFDGRSAGMKGSYAFYDDLSKGRITDNSGNVIRPSQIALMVNIDIIGANLQPVRKFWKDYVIALGGERYFDSFPEANNGPGLNVDFEYYDSKDFTNLFYRKIGDQRVFLEHGIPCVVWTSGITQHTNKVSDTPETLNYPVFARRVELIRRWVRIQLD